MKIGYSTQFESASVVIEPGENPDIEELIENAQRWGAIWHNEEDGIDIVVDDQSGRYNRGVGAELYEEDMLKQQVERGQTTFHALVS